MKRLLVALLSISLVLPVYAAKKTQNGKSATSKSKTAQTKSKKKKSNTRAQSQRQAAYK
ncbi:MAG: hypothetical protein FWG01_03750 [Betaproteobacteria bacterium]|nr:hypothetical protein [Betaproteobacteria bacterium]